jgi:hypothetical protein
MGKTISQPHANCGFSVDGGFHGTSRGQPRIDFPIREDTMADDIPGWCRPYAGSPSPFSRSRRSIGVQLTFALSICLLVRVAVLIVLSVVSSGG